ncbi:DUF6232 family protein [Streptomyces sp. NPDC050509]|uniref:DUF6232 family protein n=1 Tax=Streptomyces sp. NPDC050509 TaxID=3365620 RepID=UPI0037AA3868
MESTGPAQRPWNTPPLPLEPPPLRSVPVELRVSKRLLWVGGAAYPLQNVARVYTLTIRPRRKEAVATFCKSVLITLAVAFALTILGVASALRDEELAGNLLNVVWIVSVGALIYFFVELMSVLTAQSHYVLAVETSGPSTAVVTSANRQHLDQLAGYIAHAIENPETEFQVKVESISISPNNYYFGDNVNMYGGNGNVGMAGA